MKVEFTSMNSTCVHLAFTLPLVTVSTCLAWDGSWPFKAPRTWSKLRGPGPCDCREGMQFLKRLALNLWIKSCPKSPRHVPLPSFTILYPCPKKDERWWESAVIWRLCFHALCEELCSLQSLRSTEYFARLWELCHNFCSLTLQGIQLFVEHLQHKSKVSKGRLQKDPLLKWTATCPKTSTNSLPDLQEVKRQAQRLKCKC